MKPNQARDVYRQAASQAQIHPVKLIHLMYDRVLLHLDEAAAGVKAGSARQRGEHLGKAIALISELNAAIKPEDDSEAAQFLRGLYSSILIELPKVAINNDVTIIERSHGYIKRLKEIWEQTAMREHGFSGETVGTDGAAVMKAVEEVEEREAPARPMMQGLSVSI